MREKPYFTGISRIYAFFALFRKSGPGGNRTRVQKPIPCTSTIIVSSFSFPLLYEN